MSELQEEVKIQFKSEPKQEVCVRFVDCEKCKHRMQCKTIVFTVLLTIGACIAFVSGICAAMIGV